MFSEHAEMMDLSSSDVSDSEVSIPTRGMSIYKSDWNGVDLTTSERIRRTIESINKAKESLKRKKIRYDRKKQQLELKSMELANRERRIKELEEQLNEHNDRFSLSADESVLNETKSVHSTSVNKQLEMENIRLRKEISDLHLQLELQSRTTKFGYNADKEEYRTRLMELSRREQELLRKEKEIDEYHEEAARLRLEAEEKQREADRLYYSKQKYIDELETAQKQLSSREVELNDMERMKSEAIEQRREQVKLLEEEFAHQCEEFEKREKALERREKELFEHQEEMEQKLAERESKLGEHQEEIEAALVNLKETQKLYNNMNMFVKEKRDSLLAKETDLRKQQQQLEVKQKQVSASETEFIREHSVRLDCENQIKQYQEKMEGYEKRINDLQSLVAEARNENMKLSQEYMRYKDIGDTADRRVSLFSKTNEELQQKIESQNIFILQLQKRIAELQESNYFIANDHSRATLALNEVNDQVSRLLAVVNARSPSKQLPGQSGLSTASFVQQDGLRKELFPSNPEEAKEEDIALDSNFSIHNNENQSIDLDVLCVCSNKALLLTNNNIID